MTSSGASRRGAGLSSAGEDARLRRLVDSEPRWEGGGGVLAGEDFCGDIDLARSAGENINSQLRELGGCRHETKSGARRGVRCFCLSSRVPVKQREKNMDRPGSCLGGCRIRETGNEEPLLAAPRKSKGFARPPPSSSQALQQFLTYRHDERRARSSPAVSSPPAPGTSPRRRRPGDPGAAGPAAGTV